MSGKRGGRTNQKKSTAKTQVQQPQRPSSEPVAPGGRDLDGNGSAGGADTAESRSLRQEAKKEARLERQAQARAASESRRRRQTLQKFAIVAAIAVVVLGGGFAFYMNEAGKPGESVAQQPSPHVADVNSPHISYSTDPPTSGPHVDRTAPWGVSATPVPNELAVHNLEDGGVVINYSPDLDKATVDRLAELVRTYDTEVLMTAHPGMSTPIALTAWGRIDRLGSFDEARIKRFIAAFRGQDHHAQSGG